VKISSRISATFRTMASVTFYTYPLAFNPAKAKLALEEKGIKYVEKKIDIIGSEALEPWYIKLNPAGSAPTLVVGEKVIPESADIIRFQWRWLCSEDQQQPQDKSGRVLRQEKSRSSGCVQEED
jgi:glutaredoxin